MRQLQKYLNILLLALLILAMSNAWLIYGLLQKTFQMSRDICMLKSMLAHLRYNQQGVYRI